MGLVEREEISFYQSIKMTNIKKVKHTKSRNMIRPQSAL